MSSSSEAQKGDKQEESAKDGQKLDAKVEEREIELTASWKGVSACVCVY